MKYYELIATAFLKESMHFSQVNNYISRIINKAMSMDKELLQKHLNKGYKHYVYSGFYPIEIAKTYQQGRIYIFRIHSLDPYFTEKIRINLPLVNDDAIKIISIQMEQCHKRYINHIYTATPAVATIDHKYWTIGDDILLLEERIHNNLEKKYKSFYNEEIAANQPFMSSIEILNHKPILYKYKNTSIIGNRFRLNINSDEISQKLAFIAVATGLLEKNSSLGMGFCLAK